MEVERAWSGESRIDHKEDILAIDSAIASITGSASKRRCKRTLARTLRRFHEHLSQIFDIHAAVWDDIPADLYGPLALRNARRVTRGAQLPEEAAVDAGIAPPAGESRSADRLTCRLSRCETPRVRAASPCYFCRCAQNVRAK